MIAYLSGKIVLKKLGFVILNVAGVGYEVFISKITEQGLPEAGSELTLFCYLDVGERILRLFGFLTYDELELFKIIRSISGVGPKASLEIASNGPIEEIKKQIDTGGIKFLDKVPGIGPKKASKIILELSGKLKSLVPKKQKLKQDDGMEGDEAFLALCSLGFPKDKCKQALSQIPQDITDNQEKIKQALQILGK